MNMNEYFPQSSFSKQILASVPRKVAFWLGQLARVGLPTEKMQSGTAHGLTWRISEDPSIFSTIEFTNPAAIDLSKETIEIAWTRDKEGIILEVCGNQEFFTNIENHLSEFTELENDIYEALTKYEEELERNFSALQAS